MDDNYKAIEKQIAQKYLNACAEYENSYDVDAGKYTKISYVEIFKDHLTAAEMCTGFAMLLYMFGRKWWNDTIAVCEGLGAVMPPISND